jgi:hypothetical protein
MNRRAFLASVAAAVTGSAIATRPLLQRKKIGDTLFNPRENLHAQWLAAHEGLSIRVIRRWDDRRGEYVTRMDALWSFPPVRCEPMTRAAFAALYPSALVARG